jgi:sugar O-acyltransferase (sialic acid O-acetyltransferase NeuD family)
VVRVSGEPALRRIILLGAGGHGRVVLDALRSYADVEVLGFIDADPTVRQVDGASVIGDDTKLGSLRGLGITHGVVTVGSVQPSARRAELFEKLRAAGLAGAIVIHPSATVAPSAEIGEGSVVLARSVVNPGARVGRNVILNTGAIVEHDCVIGDHVHVSPGAVLGGGSHVGEGSHVGISACVVQGIRVGERVLVAAGAVVVRDIPDGWRVAGVPAKPME